MQIAHITQQSQRLNEIVQYGELEHGEATELDIIVQDLKVSLFP